MGTASIFFPRKSASDGVSKPALVTIPALCEKLSMNLSWLTGFIVTFPSE